MREMCGYPGCQAPEIEFVAGQWWAHTEPGNQGHGAVVGTPAKASSAQSRLGNPLAFALQDEAASGGPPPEIEPQTIGGPLESLPRNPRRLVELATAASWRVSWSTSPTFVIVQGRRDGHRLHASWRNGKFEGCFADLVTRLSSKEMFQYVQREDLTR